MYMLLLYIDIQSWKVSLTTLLSLVLYCSTIKWSSLSTFRYFSCQHTCIIVWYQFVCAMYTQIIPQTTVYTTLLIKIVNIT